MLATTISGYQILNDPLKNRGTAFTDTERAELGLFGLLPPHVATLDEQVDRRIAALRAFESDIERYAFLRDLQDTNEVLFYAVLVRNISELLPIVYTPTVGEGCERFSQLYRKARGLFLSPPYADKLDAILSNPRFDDVQAIVATDGERILGLGDQGAGGMGIPIGKLALYTACGGIHPAGTLPIMLDLGTDNTDRLNDPLYIGWRHERVRGQAYDEFLDAFVAAVKKRWPHVLLQFEDFAKENAARLLERYRDTLCTFNDDIQGTAAVATGTLLSAIHVTGEKLSEQRIAILGAGSAGCGIAALMLQAFVDAGMDRSEAAGHFFLVDRDGLLIEGMGKVTPSQQQFLTKKDVVKDWQLESSGTIMFEDVVKNIKPTVLIGVSGQAGAFTQQVIEAMASVVERPIIFPLSNPTSCAEAKPADIMKWTKGKALIGTGSPFPPIERNGKSVAVDQTNNSYIFPGVGLGVVAAQARRVSDKMFMQAAKALADASPALRDADATLLPPVQHLRDVSVSVAIAVAQQAQREGLSDIDPAQIESKVRATVWEPLYAVWK